MSEEEAHELLDRAWENGINFIDTANVYGFGASEEWIGNWLEDHDRNDLVIASKVYFRMRKGPNGHGLSRKHIRDQIEGTLDRLGTDYLDVYYIHRWDDDTPIEETLATLTELVEEGKVHYLGASTMAAWKLTKALYTADVEGYERLSVTQPLFHAVRRDEVTNYLDVCADQNLAVCPYASLDGGFLTGKYERDGDGGVVAPEGSRAENDPEFSEYYVSERAWHVLDAIREVAEEVSATPAQVALRWQIEHDAFTCVPVFGALDPSHIDENAGAVDISLSSDQIARIDDARYDDDGELYEGVAAPHEK